MDERLLEITRCMKELEHCEIQLKTKAVSDPMLPLLGQMDWLAELHYQLYV